MDGFRCRNSSHRLSCKSLPQSPQRNSQFYLTPLIRTATVGLLTLYRSCNPEFRFVQAVPRRCLTKPSEPLSNEFDNSLHDYILHVNDILSDDQGNDYAVLDLLGTGTFGQVVKCCHQQTGGVFAVKVIKNLPAYFNQAWVEINILRMLHRNNSPDDTQHIVKFYSHFIFRGHLCLVFEKLSINLYELLKQNSYTGVSLEMLQTILSQVLQALNVLVQSDVIHCDLKPENILLKSLDTSQLKIIDFGSACQLHYPVYSYVQSRFYRSPEVLLGAPGYDSKIDMWSVGCVAGELFLGIPLFPGQNEMNMVCRIVEMLGDMPDRFLRLCRHANKFFNCPRSSSEYGVGEMQMYHLKTGSQYEEENNTCLPKWKRFFVRKKLRDIITNYPYYCTPQSRLREMTLRESLVDLLKGMLAIDPRDRWSPSEALQHPFLKGCPLPDGQPWNPPSRSRLLRRSRPVSIAVRNGDGSALAHGIYSTSAPNFTAKGSMDIHTMCTWGAGTGGQLTRLGSGSGSSHHIRCTPVPSAFPETVGEILTGTSFASGSYAPSSTFFMHGSALGTKDLTSSTPTDACEDSDHTNFILPTRNMNTCPFLFPDTCYGGSSARNSSSAGEFPNAIVSASARPLSYSAMVKTSPCLHISGSCESLPGSMKLSRSRENLGFPKESTGFDFGDDAMLPFALDEDVPLSEETQSYVHHREPESLFQAGVSTSVPPIGSRASCGLLGPQKGHASALAPAEYFCRTHKRPVKQLIASMRLMQFINYCIIDVDREATISM